MSKKDGHLYPGSKPKGRRAGEGKKLKILAAIENLPIKEAIGNNVPGPTKDKILTKILRMLETPEDD